MRQKLFYQISIFYLSISTLVFFSTWLISPLSYFFSGLFVIVLFFWIKEVQVSDELLQEINKRDVFILVLASLILSVLSGSGGFSFQSFDYIHQNSKLNDIAKSDLPIYFQSANSFSTYYFGYYIPPGLFIKYFNLQQYSIVYLIWTTLGIFLGLGLLFVCINRSLKKLFSIFLFGGVFPFASSLINYFDTPLKLITSGYEPNTKMRLSFLSLMGNFVYVPNQIIPVLIVTPIVLFDLSKRNYIRPIFPISLTIFWSPFPFLGLLVLYGCTLLFNEYKSSFAFVNMKKLIFNAFLNVLTFCPLLIYLTSGLSELEMGFFYEFQENYIPKWLIFLFLEVLIFFFFLRKTIFYRTPLQISVLSLCIIPLYKIGLGNDFCMRVSMPFLLVLYLCLAQFIFSNKFGSKILIFVLLLGSIQPIKIIARGFITFDINGYKKVSYSKFLDTYDSLIKTYNKQIANQYLMDPNSKFYKYLLNKGDS
jgi:hypothetical protein